MTLWTQVVVQAGWQAYGEALDHRQILASDDNLCAEDRALLSGLVKRFQAVTQWCNRRLERME